MPRVLLSLLLLACLAAPASAQSRPQVSGDPQIDAQWAAQLRRPASMRVAPAPPPRRATSQAMFAPAKRRAKVQAPAPRTIDPAFLPSVVPDPTGEPAGTIVIDTSSRYLYLVQEGGMAQRYGVGVGREGFGWSGTVKIGRKAEWPTWTPPAEMRKRQPYLPVSMAGGPKYPLGARALYLYDGGRDTLYRIHGSNEPWTIGHSVSSGCFRMRNEDVIELYNRVPVGTKVVVI
jgi:lipoprotein-anchoring transpeptidase ErfK/SrfK